MRSPRFPITALCISVLVCFCGLIESSLAAGNRLSIAGQTIDVVGDLKGFDLSLRTRTIESGLDVALLTLYRDEAAPPPRITVKWSQASQDIAGVWTPDFSAGRTVPPDWREIGKHLHSMLTVQAPVLALFGSDGTNRLTVAVSDAVNPVLLDARVREEDARVYQSIDLFSERHEKVRSFGVEIRFDARPVPYYMALRDVAEWWAGLPGYRPVPVPEIAREPMYSTWYSYHQNLDPDRLLDEVRAARLMGFRAIIVDDGWQTLDSSRGYAFAGDWKPERLTGMRKFVDAVHAEGMKALLWYSVPFVGEKSAAYGKFRGKFLECIDHYGACVLDPRYPEVRRYLIDHYKRAVGVWGWDGLKLDFIDRFRTQDDTVLEATGGRDYASVYDAVDRLMTDVITELRAIEPDVAIEFRQHYIGPKMRTYGNMFRAHDSPNLAFVNRRKVVDLRLLSGDTAVHSDMIMWHDHEPVQIAAFQLLNVLFSVPQVSVRLGDIPEDHAEMIRFWIDYWRRNRGVLLDGALEADSPLLNYPIVSGRTGEKRIVALYHDQVVDLDASDGARGEIDVVNAKNSRRVVLDAHGEMGRYEAVVRDCRGIEQSRRAVRLKKGVVSFDVPVSGLLSLRRAARPR